MFWGCFLVENQDINVLNDIKINIVQSLHYQFSRSHTNELTSFRILDQDLNPSFSVASIFKENFSGDYIFFFLVVCVLKCVCVVRCLSSWAGKNCYPKAKGLE